MPNWEPHKWSEVERLFAHALDLPPEQRAGFLEQACADPGLRREVASLLENADLGLPSVDEAIAAATSELAGETNPDERLIGARLGPYRVEAIAGHGGMGAVYRASRDDAEFHQRVAIKLVRAAAESPAALRRFKQERQILARLAHPHIARLLDGGSTPEGVPYLVMEFIEGEPITTWCAQRSLAIRDRLRLFLHVCEAVDFAHRERVVHRDLKPANILVTHDGVPKLLDFGIAKLLNGAGGALSLTSLHVMTPDYASPEQVRGEAVSVVTDIYALGLVLYELLTGQKAQDIPTYTPGAIAKVVCQSEPKAPAALNPQLSGDLDNIIRMAIRKEPERRYQSTADMARDIERHLEGRTVAARPDTIGYRAAKFLRRNRAAASVTAVATAVLVLALGYAFLSGRLARTPRVSRVVQITQFGRAELGDGIATDGSWVYFTERKGGYWGLDRVSVEGGAPQPMLPPGALAQPEIADISPDRSQLLVSAGSLSTYDDRPLYLVSTSGESVRSFGGLSGHAGAWSPDGRQVLVCRGHAIFRANSDGSGYRKLMDLPDRADQIHWSPKAGSDVLRFSMAHPESKSRSLWEARADGTHLHPLPLRDWTSAKSWSETDDIGIWVPSEKYYLFRSRRGLITSIWARREPHGFAGGFSGRAAQIYSTPLLLSFLAAGKDDKRIFFSAGQERREFARYDAKIGQFVPFLPGVAGRAVSFSKDGRWVAYTTFLDGVLWRSRLDGSERQQLTPPGVAAVGPQLSPDGTRIVFGSPPPRLFLVPMTGGPLELLTPAGMWEGDPSWSPDGRSLLVRRGLPRMLNAGLYITNLATREADLLPGSESLSHPAWSPDGRYIAANNSGKQIQIWDQRARHWTTLASGNGLAGIFWSRDGRYLYFQDVFGDTEQPIFSVRISDRRIERVAGFSQIPQSDLAGFVLAGLDPGDAPIVSLIHTNSDIYALDLDWP